MTVNSSRIRLTLVIGTSLLVVGVVYAAIALNFGWARATTLDCGGVRPR